MFFYRLANNARSGILHKITSPNVVRSRTITNGHKFPRVFTRTPISRFSVRKYALAAAPVFLGVALYSYPREQDLLSTIMRSAAMIPERQPTPTILFSPQEPQRSIPSRILSLLNDHIWEPILTTGRFIHLFFLFFPVIVCSPMLLVGKPEKRLKGDRWGAVWWYDLLVSRMQAAGPTFIKLSQWAGSRADLFPTMLCDRLGSMHSRGKPHSLAHTKRVIEKVFGRPFDEVFEEFDGTPIGTGAIAQVYKAKLKQDLIPPSFLGPRRNGDTHPATAAALALNNPAPSVPSAAVAVKVLHPRVHTNISRDLAIMSFFANALNLLPGMEWLSLPEEVDVFGDMMSQQLNLRNEADNLVAFEKNFAGRNIPATFPRPLIDWSTRDLLVEEYENALPLEWFLKHGGGPYNEQMATVGLDAFLNMLLLDNFVHADLHPGNIMIKFLKPPTTSMLLKNIGSALFPSFFAEASENGGTAGSLHPADRESDDVVDKLRSTKHDPAAWNAQLADLYVDGYIPEIVFIDAGLVTTLSSTNRRNFLDLFQAIAHFDGYLTGQLMVARSKTPELAIDTEHFALKMQNIVLSVKRKTFSLGQIKISDILTDVLKAVRNHHVKLEGDFVNTVISALLLEGIGRRLDPSLDLFKSALPILRQVGGTMAVEEGKKGFQTMPSEDFGSLVKVWVWMETRQMIGSAIVNADEMVRYDWLTPAI